MKSGFLQGWVELTEAAMGILGCEKRSRLGSIKYGGPQKTTENKRNPKDLEAISAGFTTDHIALFHVQRIWVCGKSELQSVGGPGNSEAGCLFNSRVLHFKVRGDSQNSGWYSHPYQCNMNTNSGHSALTVFYKICVNNNKICLWRTENIYEISRNKHRGARSIWALRP